VVSIVSPKSNKDVDGLLWSYKWDRSNQSHLLVPKPNRLSEEPHTPDAGIPRLARKPIELSGGPNG
jgi:hypothetical protein